MSQRRLKPDSRAARVRALLESNPEREFSLREIRDSVDCEAAMNNVSGTLSTLASRGDVLRVFDKVGKARFRANTGECREARQAPSPRTPPPPTAAARESITGLARAARSKPPRASALDKATNFHAAPGTADTRYCPKRAASQEIANHIAQFQRHGGRIQKLGITKIFHHPSGLADNDD